MGTAIHHNGAWNRPLRALSFLPLAALLAVSLSPDAAPAAPNVRVLVDGRTLTVSDPGSTVREALAEARVSLDADDEVTPARDQRIPADGVIRVRRVRYATETVEIKIPFRTIVRAATSKVRPYHPTVTKAGRTGLKRVTYRAKVVDGREVERSTVSEEVVREPEHEVVISRKQLASRGVYAGNRVLKVLATAYDPGVGSCGKWADGKTCNGKRAGYGIIAVDPKVIPLGAKIFVPGYGYGIAADVGGAIKGNRIDLGFNSRSGSFQWGKKWVTISIVD